MDFGNAFLRPRLQSVAVFTALFVFAQIPPTLAVDISPINLDICTVQGLPVPDPLNEISVTTSVLAVMADIPPPPPVYDDRRANDCCILITPPDHEYRISIAARLAVEARFLRLRDENAVRHLNQLIEYCEDEITEAAYLSAYGGPPFGGSPSDGSTGLSPDGGGDSGGGGGGGGIPPNSSSN